MNIIVEKAPNPPPAPVPCQVSSPEIASDGRTLNFPVFDRINLQFSCQLHSTADF